MRSSRFLIAFVVFLFMYTAGRAVPVAHATEVIIDDTIFDATDEYGAGPAGVFISDGVGYVFYVDGSSDAVYRKTTDGGNTWGDPVVLDPDKTWHTISVWYDQWTTGGTGGIIHVAGAEAGTDDAWYNSVDTTSSDAVSGWVVVDLGTARAPPDGEISIAKSTEGYLFISTFRSTVLGGAILRSTTGGSSWSDITPSGVDDDDDHAQFMPLTGGDVLLIFWDESSSTLQSNIWDESGDAWVGWTTIDSGIVTDTTYDAMFSAVLSKTSNDIYLAYNNDTDATTSDFKAWKFDEGLRSWSVLADIGTDIAESSDVALALDENTDDLYAFYIHGTNAAATTHVYYKVSTDDGGSWSSEIQLSDTLDDLRIVRTNFRSDERIYAFWYNDDLNYILGTTVVNLTPAIPEITILQTVDQETSIVTGPHENYVGSLKMSRGIGSTTVTQMVFTETGTVNAYANLAHLRMLYETTDTCDFDGTETVFGSAAFDSNEQATITGSMTVGTSNVCVYFTVQAMTGAYRKTLELQINSPPTDVTVAAGTVAPDFIREIPGTTYIGHEVTIDDSLFDATDEYNPSPNVVFLGTGTGYVFFVDGDGYVAYRKTVNGGSVWSDAVTLTSATTMWANVAVWYDRWTPGDDSGTKIHIAAAEAATDDIWYHALDTSDDSLDADGWISVVAGTTYTPATSGGPSIAKSTDGNLFLLGFTNTFGQVYKSTDGNSWADTSVGGAIDDADIGQLLPLSGGDILLITQDISVNAAQSQVYDEATDTWDGSWTSIDTWVENSTYDAMWGASLNRATGDVYLVGNTAVLNEAADIAAYKYDEGDRSWSVLADVIHESPYVLQATMAVDEATGDLYAFYLAGSVADAVNVFFKRSEDGGQTWSVQSRALNFELGDDFKNLRTNFMSADRLFAIWYNDDLEDLQGGSIMFRDPAGVEAYVIDPTGGDATAQYNPSPNTVFLSDLTGYIFYVDSTTDVVYRKTVDGGKSWGSPTALSPDKTWLDVAVWYDQWTMDDSGTKIHLVASESETDGIWYHAFDTNDESLDTDGWLNIFDVDAIAAGGAGTPSITKSTAGNLFIIGNGTTSLPTTQVVKVYKSVDGGDNWADTSFSPSGGVQNTDQGQLLPLATGDDVLLIYQDVSADSLLSLEYDEGTNGWTNEQTVDASFVDNGTYDAQWGGSYYKATGDIYVAGMNAIAVATADMKLYKFTESSRTWAVQSAILTDTAETTQGKVFVDDNTGDLYVAYNKLRTGQVLPNAMTIFYRYSDDDGVTWSDEMQLSTTEDDLKYIRGNLTSNERLYASWFNDDLNDVIGGIVADLVPPEEPEEDAGGGYFYFLFGQ